MQVWNLLHAARWKCRTQKSRQKSPSGHHRTSLSGYIFAIRPKARIDNRKKLVKQRYVLHMSSQYGELRPTNGWDPSGSMRHPCKFKRVSRLGTVTARHLVAGVSQTLRRWTEGATCVRQGDHHVGHWPTHILVPFRWRLSASTVTSKDCRRHIIVIVIICIIIILIHIAKCRENATE